LSVSTKSSITPAPFGKVHADALARESIATYSVIANTSKKQAGSEGIPFYNIYGLAKEYEEH
jgi:hypothetical protein